MQTHIAHVHTDTLVQQCMRTVRCTHRYMHTQAEHKDISDSIPTDLHGNARYPGTLCKHTDSVEMCTHRSRLKCEDKHCTHTDAHVECRPTATSGDSCANSHKHPDTVPRPRRAGGIVHKCVHVTYEAADQIRRNMAARCALWTLCVPLCAEMPVCTPTCNRVHKCYVSLGI